MTRHDLIGRSTLSLVLASGCVQDVSPVADQQSTITPPADQVITIDPSGNFSPQHVTVSSGQAVRWVLYNRATDAIARVTGAFTWPAVCSATSVYTPGVNELTGPLRRAQSGVFTLNPDRYGFKVTQLAEMTIARPSNLCPATGNLGIPLDETVPGSGPYLCEQTGDATYYQKTLESETWDSPSITGVFIRLHWRDVHTAPGVFHWDALDDEIRQAVAKNKLYSIAIQAGEDGTPEWMYTANPAVTRLTFDANHEDDSCRYRSFGDITDPDYATYYKAMLSDLATHLKSNADWYRRLAYIKPSGANLSTAENRLPSGCKSTPGPGCDGVPSCNNQRWVTAGYTPQKLYDFYNDQLAHIALHFPNKTMSYALIQDGFPRANADGGAGCYDTAAHASNCAAPYAVPRGSEQTETILQAFRASYLEEAVVQHNGLGEGTLCPAPGTNGGGCPNWWAYIAGATLFPATTYGQAIGFQTKNGSDLNTSLALHHTFQNLWNNSSGDFLEIYEPVHWKARYSHFGILNLGQGEPAKSLSDWRNDLNGRRDALFPTTAIPSTSPAEHRVTFVRTLPSPRSQRIYFINPAGSTCAGSARAWGSVTIDP